MGEADYELAVTDSAAEAMEAVAAATKIDLERKERALDILERMHEQPGQLRHRLRLRGLDQRHCSTH